MSDDFLHKLFQRFVEGNVRPPETNADEQFVNTNPRGSFFDSQNGEGVTIERDYGSMFDFTPVFPDPFEIQKHFEQRFLDVFKSFSFETEDFFNQQEHGQFQYPNMPTIEGKDPRDYFLKPGLGKPQMSPNEENSGVFDKRATPWLDSIVPSESLPEHESVPRVFSSFSSVTKTSIRLPDGTVKSEEIIRKPDGTEERRKSQTFPDESSQNIDVPFVNPGSFFSDFFNFPKLGLPETVPKETNPRDQFLKPGYEKLTPFDKKVDKDLDEQIQREGLSSLPLLPKHPENELTKGKSPIKTVIKSTVTLPNGVAETKETVCYSDGTEHVTVTKKSPDGPTTNTTDSFLKGTNNPLEPRSNINEAKFILKGIKDMMELFFK